MKRNKEKKNERMRVSMDIEDVWRYSLETMLLVINEANEQKMNPNKRPRAIMEIVRSSSVRPIKVVIFKAEKEPDTRHESDCRVPIGKSRDNAGNAEYPVNPYTEIPRYVM